MIESVGIGLNKQIKGEQKLTGKNSQLISGIKIGDILKGSLTKLENGQIVLLSEGKGTIPVKLQGMAIFHEAIALEVLQKEEGQILLKLLQSEDLSPKLLQDKIINEMNLPKTDPMRALIEAFLVKQMPLQRDILLKNYHMHQSFQIPTEVLTNLSNENGGISLQEVKALYEVKQGNMAQLLTQIGELVTDVQDKGMTTKLLNTLVQYLDENRVEALLKTVFKNNESIKHSNQVVLNQEVDVQPPMVKAIFKEAFTPIASTVNSKEVLLKENEEVIKALLRSCTSESWEKLGKATASLLLEALTIDMTKLQDGLEESKHIENMNKVLKEVLKTLEDTSLPEKYNGTLKQLEDAVQVINKFNVEGEYYFFPLNLPQGEGKGELYFFKPKKTAKQQAKRLYVVLALELPQLKNIEIHMRQEGENLLLHFKVKKKNMLQLLETHIKDLKQLMAPTRFNLDEVKFSLLEKKPEGTFLEPLGNVVNHMDFKV